MSTDRYNKLEEIAGDWLARRDSGRWTEDDQRRFEQWLNESPLHRVTYLRIEHAWERSARLSVLGAGGKGATRVSEPGFPYLRRGMAIAASVLFAIALSVGGYRFWAGSGELYVTPVGGLTAVPMPDGSKVTLNTDSEVRVAVSDDERLVELRQGEAFFEVARDPARPFIVLAGDKRVIAVGTKFSVRREANDIEVVVTEGKVRVETEASSSAEPLVAGTIAQASDAGVLIQTKPLIEAEEALSWRQGVLIFRQMTLGEASAEFNRYNDRKIVIEDPNVAGLRIAGSFRANNVDAFVRLLERGYPLRAEEREGRFVLSAR